jgi:adenine-specific DNA methylase
VSTATAAAPRTWPARYRLHKYWSRKPGDVVAAAIERHTSPGELVLDPFCGSGVTAFEGHVLGRRVVAVDANPFAIALAAATLARCDPDRLAGAADRVLRRAAADEERWHRTRCRSCGADATLAGTARAGAEIVAVLVRCDRCGGLRRSAPEPADRRLAAAAEAPGDGGAPRPPVFRGWQTRKLVRAGLVDFGELFTTRNLRALAAVRRAILAEPDPAERDLLLIGLTGALAQASRMMADHSAAGGGASWKLNIYWLPRRSLELHPLGCVANRFRRLVAAKRETEPLLAAAPARSPRLVRADARGLDRLVPPGSARYVFADPPYGGEGIQYAELSALWCAWLEPALEPALDEEIGENPTRDRDAAAYAAGLRDAFAAIRRAIADDGRMTVTFASSDRRSWAALDAALAAAEFVVGEVRPLPRSAPGLTERTSAGSTRADAWLECRPC